MAYDHANKVGNQGDLIKHAVLYTVVKNMLDTWPEGECFRYADTHTGHPCYVLPSGGAWMQGIGAFSRLPGIARQRRDESNESASEFLEPTSMGLLEEE